MGKCKKVITSQTMIKMPRINNQRGGSLKEERVIKIRMKLEAEEVQNPD
jgi:hypothetical protein